MFLLNMNTIAAILINLLARTVTAAPVEFQYPLASSDVDATSFGPYILPSSTFGPYILPSSTAAEVSIAAVPWSNTASWVTFTSTTTVFVSPTSSAEGVDASPTLTLSVVGAGYPPGTGSPPDVPQRTNVPSTLCVYMCTNINWAGSCEHLCGSPGLCCKWCIRQYATAD